MIRKYTVTDWSGKDIYLETFDEDEAVLEQHHRSKAMDCYLNEIQVTYEDVQYMSDEERLDMYRAVNEDYSLDIDVRSDDFWDWVEMELDE